MKANHKFLEKLLDLKLMQDNKVTDHLLHTAAKVILTNSFVPIAQMVPHHMTILLNVFPQAVNEWPHIQRFYRPPPRNMVAPLQEVEDLDTWKEIFEITKP